MMISAEAMGHSTRLARVLGDIDVEEFGDPTEEIDLFAGCHSVADVRTVLREQVKIETSAMLELVAEADAFDVIELRVPARSRSTRDDARWVSAGGGDGGCSLAFSVQPETEWYPARGDSSA
ncbi:MAG: hypothetical protein ACTJGT_01260 [Microbacteriaceae bacterium]